MTGVDLWLEWLESSGQYWNKANLMTERNHQEGVEAKLAEAKRVLRLVEWVDDNQYGDACPLCFGRKDNDAVVAMSRGTIGHAPDCALAKALSDA